MFWKILKSTSDDLDSSTITKNNPKDHEWVSHFKKLHAKHDLNNEQSEIVEQLNIKEKNRSQFNELDDTNSENELNAVKKLKTKKLHIQIE